MMKLHAPRPDNARTACAGDNFGDHAAAMAEKMRGKPFEGDPTQEIRKGGFWGFWKLNREFVGPGGELVYPIAAIASITKARSRSCSANGASI